MMNSFGFIPSWLDSCTQHLFRLEVSTLRNEHAEFGLVYDAWQIISILNPAGFFNGKSCHLDWWQKFCVWTKWGYKNENQGSFPFPVSAHWRRYILHHVLLFHHVWYWMGVLLDSRPRWTVQSRHEACMFTPYRHTYTEQHQLRAPRSPLKAPYRLRRCVMRPPGKRVDRGHRHPVTLTYSI